MGPAAAWSHDPMLWSSAAMKMAVDVCFWWVERGLGLGHPEYPEEATLPWTTPNRVALELATLRLRDFSRRQTGQAVLICAPYALHRAMIADFAPGHSIVATLQNGGLDRLYMTDWRSATPDMRWFTIDSYLAELNVAVDQIGPPVDLIGLCQGGWLSLIYCARFPEKVRRLVLVGAPVDLSVESELSLMVAAASPRAFSGLVDSGGGVVRGDHMLRFWSLSPDVELVLQRKLSPEVAVEKELLARFRRWHDMTLDLPGTYYLQVVNWIFRENRLAKGSFVALGREVDLAQVKTPVFLLAGTDDEVVPAAQALATASLLGTPAALLKTATVPSTHLGLFAGSQTLANSWPRIAWWLQSDEPGRRAALA